MLNTKFAFFAAMCLALCGCATKTQPLQSTATLNVVTDSALPMPNGADQSGATRPYLVGPYDKLIVDVFGIKELTERKVQVDANGNLSFPIAGSVQAAGLTPDQLAQAIETKLAGAYVRDPQVTVNLEEAVSQYLTVDGQVMRPGLYPVLGNMSLIRAVAKAEGTTEFAKTDDVVVFRNSGGQRYAALYNLGAIRRGYYDDPALYAGDIVVVGESRARRMFRDILQSAPLLLSPVIAVLQNSGN